MAENVEETISKMLMTTEFSLQLNESTLPGNESLLLTDVRFIKGGSLYQELLFARLLKRDTKVESVYRDVEDYFQKKKAIYLQTSSQMAPRAWLVATVDLKRFYSMFNRVLDFWKKSDHELYDKLKSSKTYIAYLTEMFFKFNEVNLQLQGDKTSLTKAKSALSSFLTKLQLYSRNLERCEFSQFPCLSDLEKKTGVKGNDIAVNCAHLAELHRDIPVRFNDLFSLEIPGCVIDPFTEPSTEAPTHLEKELVSSQNDEDLKPKFKTSYQAFWMQTTIPKRYPALWKDIKWFFIAFPTSYLVERGFSFLARLLTKKKNQHNRAWGSETAPDKSSSWCWQFDCNAPSPPISLNRVVVNDYSFSFTIYFMFSSRC